MLVGLNTSFSFFGGSVLAWGIIGPALVHNGAAFGASYAPDDPRWESWTNFASLSSKFSTKDHPSPRFWLLWPGVLLMIVVSFTELFLQYKVFYFVGKAVFRGSCEGLNALMRKAGKESPWLAKQGAKPDSEPVQDFADEKDQVQWWMWLPLLILVIICACVVLGVQFDMPVGMSLLSVFLAFFFSFLAVQCSGVTDITPLTAVSSQ